MALNNGEVEQATKHLIEKAIPELASSLPSLLEEEEVKKDILHYYFVFQKLFSILKKGSKQSQEDRARARCS